MNKSQSTILLGAKLKSHFESEGITQMELANEFATKQSWISRIYSGEFTKRSVVAKKLCEKAKLSFFDEDDVEVNESKIFHIAAQLSTLNSSELKAFEKLGHLLKKL